MPTSTALLPPLANRFAISRERNLKTSMALSTGRMMRFAAIGFEFAWPMIAGAIIGHYLDLYFHTDPWLTLVMFLLGVFIGFYRLIQELTLFQRENQEP
jgi:ATP synthase protein I